MSKEQPPEEYVGQFYGRHIHAKPEAAELIRRLQSELDEQRQQHARDLRAMAGR